MPKPTVVAYYLSRFPKLSETFILREISGLRESAVDVQIFSVLSPKASHTMHEQVQELLPYTHYAPIFSLKILFSQFHFIFRSPKRYFQALKHLIWQTLPEPSTLLMALALFPKSVYFARKLEKLQVEHIHSHFVWVNAVAAQVAADLLDTPCSIHAHAWDIFRRKQECVRRQLQLASSVVTVSDYHRQYLQNICQTGTCPDIHIVHYGIDPDEFKPPVIVNTNSRMLITSVGRLVEKKGFTYLIEACAILKHKGYVFHCSIIGSGDRDGLQSQIENNGVMDCVTMLGEKNISEILEQYRVTDIFALPCVIAKSGDRDGMPNVLLEAMSMQIPVITTPVTGNPELIRDGENGLLVPAGDSASLADAIERLINDRPLREKLGKQARQTILESFDINSTTDQMAMIFQEYSSTTNSSTSR